MTKAQEETLHALKDKAWIRNGYLVARYAYKLSRRRIGTRTFQWLQDSGHIKPVLASSLEKPDPEIRFWPIWVHRDDPRPSTNPLWPKPLK